MNKLLVMIATYNEAKNVEPLLRALLDLELDLDVLFIDDNSPDGTGRIIDRLVQAHSNVYVQHRSRKIGIGAAHKDGISWAYQHGYSHLLTMDCDFTHSPDNIEDFIAAKDLADVTVGTRFVPEGLRDWGYYRTIQSHVAHAVTTLLLGMPYDASGGFRIYCLQRLPQEMFSLLRHTSYSFFWESLHVIWLNGYSIHQIPIKLAARSFGTSKMRIRDVFGGFLDLVTTFLRKKFSRSSFMIASHDDPH